MSGHAVPVAKRRLTRELKVLRMGFIANMKIRSKLAALILLLLAMMVGGGVLAIHQLLKEEALTFQIRDNLIPSIEVAGQMSDTQLRKRIQVLRLMSAISETERQGYIKENQRLNQRMSDLFGRYTSLVSADDERQAFADFQSRFREYDDIMVNEYIPMLAGGGSRQDFCLHAKAEGRGGGGSEQLGFADKEQQCAS